METVHRHPGDHRGSVCHPESANQHPGRTGLRGDHDGHPQHFERDQPARTDLPRRGLEPRCAGCAEHYHRLPADHPTVGCRIIPSVHAGDSVDPGWNPGNLCRLQFEVPGQDYEEAKLLASRAAAQVGSTVSGTAYRAAGTVSGVAGATAADVAGFGTADVSASRRTAADVKTGYTNVVDATAGVAGDAGRAMGATAGAVASGAGGLVAAGADTAQRAGEKVAGAVDAIFTGNVDPLDTEEMAKYKYPLEYIEGSGLVYAEKLKAIGILNCQRLIKAHNTPRGRTEVAEKSGISGK